MLTRTTQETWRSPSQSSDILLRLKVVVFQPLFHGVWLDRKSTRLNSSHSQISYAVFCLKNKREQPNNPDAVLVKLPRKKSLSATPTYHSGPSMGLSSPLISARTYTATSTQANLSNISRA